jgi:hypothetical protein
MPYFDKEKDLEELFEILFSTLREREANVLRCRYLWALTLKETGILFCISPERVRQIESKAIRKLRSSSCLKLMIEYDVRDAEIELKRRVDEEVSLRDYEEQRRIINRQYRNQCHDAWLSKSQEEKKERTRIFFENKRRAENEATVRFCEQGNRCREEIRNKAACAAQKQPNVTKALFIREFIKDMLREWQVQGLKKLRQEELDRWCVAANEWRRWQEMEPTKEQQDAFITLFSKQNNK